LCCIGIRYIPLRTPGGKSTSHVGLFVKIGIENLSSEDVSASRTCVQEFEIPHKKFSSPTMPETSNLSLAKFATVDSNNQKEEDKIVTGQYKPANIDHTEVPTLQRNTNSCTIEIHMNPDVEDVSAVDVNNSNAESTA